MALSVATKKLMSMGFSFICANCVKLHVGLSRGEEHCSYALRGRHCGGPIVGLTFPEYEGPLTRPRIASVCFRCGDDSTKLVEVKGKGFVGACDKHIKMIDMMKPVELPKGRVA